MKERFKGTRPDLKNFLEKLDKNLKNIEEIINSIRCL